jgi:hypothetical protein
MALTDEESSASIISARNTSVALLECPKLALRVGRHLLVWQPFKASKHLPYLFASQTSLVEGPPREKFEAHDAECKYIR